MIRRLTAVLAMLALAPASAPAGSPVFVDSLVPQAVSLYPAVHAGLRKVALGPDRPDSLTDFHRSVVLSTTQLESRCRTGLLMKEQEPGSPWLTWRSLARVDVDDAVWYVAALSCVDSVCSAHDEPPTELLLHDRVALLAVGRKRSRVFLLPPEPATIGDEGSALVDHASAIRGDGHTVVQVHRHLESSHPCYDGGDYVASDELYVFVLRGDSLAQALVLVPHEKWDSHDDVDGDHETDRTSTLSVTPTAIRLAYQVEERQHSPDGDETKVRTTISGRGVVTLLYDRRIGRYRRSK